MKFLVITLLGFLLSCLPEVEGHSAVLETERLQPRPCTLQFSRESTLPEIAESAQKIKSECGWTEEKILELAKATFL